MTRPVAVGPLLPDMLDTATATVARAFENDAMMAWVFPSADTRLQQMGRLNRVPLQYAWRYRMPVRQTDAGAGVAIWIPPGQSMTPAGMVRSGLLTTAFQVGLPAMARFARANGAMDPIHKSAISEPHWKLVIVAVDPDLAGKGRGSALLQDGLDRIDQDGRACYLDTHTPANLPFYERFGFTVVGETRLGKGGPPAWGMLRAPSPSARGVT